MSDKTKVAFLSDVLIENFDGANRTMFKLINQIPEDRFDYVFISGQSDIKKNLIKIPSVSVPMNNRYKISIPDLVKRKLDYALNKFGPDVLHISSPSRLGDYGVRWAKKNKVPVLTIYHTDFISYIDYYLENVPLLITPTKKLVAESMKFFYKNCDLVYVPTSNINDKLKKLKIAKNNTKIWPRGIDCNFFNPKKADREWLQSITGNNNINLLFASRIVWEKNLQLLINLQKLITSNDLPHNLIIAGSGSALSEMKKRCPDSIYLGALNHTHLSKLYASADLFIFPSKTETFGNVVIEAMASGLPCIISNEGGPASFVTDHINGLIAHEGTTDNYLSLIQKLVNDSTLRKNITNNGLEFTESMDWKKLTNIYFSDIEKLARHSHSSTLSAR